MGQWQKLAYAENQSTITKLSLSTSLTHSVAKILILWQSYDQIILYYKICNPIFDFDFCFAWLIKPLLIFFSSKIVLELLNDLGIYYQYLLSKLLFANSLISIILRIEFLFDVTHF